jgi:Protein of unknown function (DUF1116)
MGVNELLHSPLAVINLGLEGFADDLAAHGVPVVQVDWSPPAGGDERLAGLLAALDSLDLVERANAETLERIFRAEPVLVDVRPAGEAIRGLEDRMVLHAGPPIGWERMSGPLRGAIAGAAVLEGWAADLEQAAALAASGALAFRPNHDFSAVAPMTGLITRSMPVMVVENRAFGNRAYSTLNEGLGKVMRFGGNDGEVLARLRWMADTLGPALAAAFRQSGGLALKGIIARGLSMGDEMHQRNVGCTGLFLREIAPALARAVDDRERLADILAVMGKAIMDPARGVAGSSIVTAMSRNGTDFGIRVSGTGDTWFTAPVEMPRGLYFPGFSEADANPDIGDSTIIETVGLGGFAMAAAPAVVGFVGAGTAADALAYTRAMYEITVGRNPDWTLPALDYAGVPTGIDVRKVVETGIAPTINTGIAHREPGIGQVGAGVVRAPMACFERALEALAAELRAA